MAETIVKRNYSLTDGELATFLSNFCLVLERDLISLTPFGLTQLKIDALKAKGDAYESLPSDEYSAGLQAIATEEKNNLLTNLVEQIGQMAWRIESKWGIDSKQYDMLGISGIHNQPEDTVLRIARSVHKTMELFLPDLVDTGLTEAMLDDFIALANDCEDAKNAQKLAIIERDANTQIRIQKGNEMYKDIALYCELGKKLFAKTDPAKYNDYIIYDTVSPGSLTPPTGLSFYFPSTTFSWNPVDNASSYRLMASVNNIDWIEVYAGESVECVYVPIQTGNMFYKVQGRNDGGLGPFSDILTQGYYPGTVLPAPENLVLQLAAGSPNTIQLNFSPVPSSTQYSINRSIVAVGAGPGPFNFVTNTHDPEYVETIIPGHRFYFNVTASNSHQWSGVSANVFIDVPE